MSNLAITASTPLVFAEPPTWEIDETQLVLAITFGGGPNHALMRLRLTEVDAGGLVSALLSGYSALTKSTQLQVQPNQTSPQRTPAQSR